MRPTLTYSSTRRRQRGVGYVGVLFLVALIGTWLAATGEATSAASARERDLQLIAVGKEYQRAIRQYYLSSPGTVPSYPSRLEDLTLDLRHLEPRRHLRRLYRDPVTGKTDWGIKRAPDGGIMGVYSSATREPIMPERLARASGISATRGRSYADFVFAFSPLISIVDRGSGSSVIAIGRKE